MARSLFIPVVVSLALHGAAVGMLLGLTGGREGVDLPTAEAGRVRAMLIQPALAAPVVAAPVSYEAPAEVLTAIGVRLGPTPAVAQRGGVLRAIDTKGLMMRARQAAGRWEAGVAGLVDRMVPVPGGEGQEKVEREGEKTGGAAGSAASVMPGNQGEGAGNNQPSAAAAVTSLSGKGQSGTSRGPGVAAGNVAPEYPEKSRRAGDVGTVKVHVVIGADGGVLSAVVGASSGKTELDEAAMRAVRRWRFVPALEGGVAVRSEADVPVVFSLRR